MNKMELVLLDNNNNIVASKNACDLKDLQPEKEVTVSNTLSADKLYAGYKIGIRFVNDSEIPAKLAIDTQYINGVNVLAELS